MGKSTRIKERDIQTTFHPTNVAGHSLHFLHSLDISYYIFSPHPTQLGPKPSASSRIQWKKKWCVSILMENALLDLRGDGLSLHWTSWVKAFNGNSHLTHWHQDHYSLHNINSLWSHPMLDVQPWENYLTSWTLVSSSAKKDKWSVMSLLALYKVLLYKVHT